MARPRWIARIIATSLLLGGAALHISAEPPKEVEIQWRSDLDEAHEQAVKQNKPMLLVFEAEWCRYCKQLRRETLAHPQLAAHINQSFVPVHLDVDRPEDKRVADVLEVKPLPCTIVLSPDADLLTRKVGFLDAEEFYSTLEDARRLQEKIQLGGHASDILQK
jgi:thiol:disulfide interchange protein